MAVLAPAALVQGAARTPLPFGLFSVVPLREGSPDRWALGVEWERDSDSALGGIGQVGAVQADALGLPKTALGPNGGGTAEASSFTVYGHFSCSPIGYTFESAQARATANLALHEESRVEQALWTGDLGNTPNFAGANGADAPEGLGSFADAKLALGAAEKFLAEHYGSQGVIHLSRAVAVGLVDHLVVTGGRLRTVLGTPVVAGTGYDDDAVVATPAMFGYRSEVFEAGGAGANFDRLHNQMTAIAERTYLVGFDPVVGRATLT